jgi:hypothetical protein
MSTPKILTTLALGWLIMTATACGPHIDVKKDLVVVDVTTGWFDAGIVRDPEGEKNKIVPSIAFRLKNATPDKTIASVQILVVYHQVIAKQEELGSTWVKAIGAEGLKPGEATGQLVLRGNLGYIGLQPRLQMLQNRDFVDGVADVQAKYGADQWVKLGTFPITRQLLTR